MTDRSTVLYPHARRLRPRADDAGGRRGWYGVPPALPRARRDRGETSDNLPGVPGSARVRREVDQPVRRADNVITHADQITGKKGEALREHLGDVIRNRRLNELVRDLDLDLTPRSWRCDRGTARRCTRSSTAWSSACCATGSSRR